MMDRKAFDLGSTTRQAADAYNRGDWGEAERLCRSGLSAQANNFDALTLLGIIAARTGRGEQAAALLARAVAARPDSPAAHNNYGKLLTSLGHYEGAADSFARALDIKPEFAEAHYNRGVALQGLRRFAEAVDSYEQALQFAPDLADAYANRGNSLADLRRFDDALESYERAMTLKPHQPEVYYNRGVTLQEVKRFDEAVQSYERSLELRPDYVQAWTNRGNALRSLDRFDDALESYGRALVLKPDFAEAHTNRGVTLQELKRFDEARDSHERALALKPNFPEAAYNHGVALQGLQRLDDALNSYEHALRINPNYAEALYNRGNVLRDLRRFPEALDSYERAMQIKPDIEWLHGTWLHTKMQLCDWSGLSSQISDLVAHAGRTRRIAPPLCVVGLVDSSALQREVAKAWAGDTHPARRIPLAFQSRGRSDRIRVGYYSADYHSHATAYLIAELIERHDRRRFDPVAFSFGPDKRDSMRERLAAAFDRFIDVRTRSDREVADMSRSLEIDIAVDLKGYTQDERHGIFLHRAAPIQVNYLGCPGTTGSEHMDYIIADHTLIPEDSRGQYSEKVVYLPNSYQVNDRQRPIADREFSREDLGLPPTGFVYCCFNNSYKITPDTFDVWMRILKRVEGSVLWLLEDNESAADNLRREAEAREVSAARLIFARRMPLPQHLARHRAADLFIDTLPCNAHTTASDALWAGLPVLTCMGESFAARVAASLLGAVGLPELITTTREQYAGLAVELAADRHRLAGIKERLLAGRLTAPLFDTELFVTHLENAYSQMHERHRAGLSPGHIHVSASG